MIIKDTKQQLENQGKSEYEIVQNIIAEKRGVKTKWRKATK